MKRLGFLFAVFLLLLGFGQANASIDWGTAPYSDFRYSLDKNGGIFYDGELDFNQIYADGSKSSAFMDQFTSKAEGSISALNPAVQMSAMAMGPKGGVNPSNGAQVQAYAVFSAPDVPTHDIDVDQKITCFITRRFTVTDPGTFDLSATMTGLVNFEAFNISKYYHAAYTLSGSVSVVEYYLSGGELHDLGGEIASISLDNDKRSDTKTALTFITNTSENNPVVYELMTLITLTTDIQNFTMTEENNRGPLKGLWELGNAADPIMLTSNLTPAAVPIPGSLLLLFSGVGGLALVRRKLGKA